MFLSLCDPEVVGHQRIVLTTFNAGVRVQVEACRRVAKLRVEVVEKTSYLLRVPPGRCDISMTGAVAGPRPPRPPRPGRLGRAWPVADSPERNNAVMPCKSEWLAFGKRNGSLHTCLALEVRFAWLRRR